MTAIADYSVIAKELTDCTEAGTISLGLIEVAIDSVHPDGFDGIPYSQGLRWIARHTQMFLELLEEAGVTVEDFFRPHIAGFYTATHLLHNEWLLLALGDERRTPFVREVFLAAGSMYGDWLEIALRANISRDDLAEMILEKLRRTEVQYKFNNSNFTKHDFMQSGIGGLRRLWDGPFVIERSDTYWGVLTDEQLFGAMQIVAHTAPNLLFSSHRDPISIPEMLRLRLTDKQVDALLELAAGNLQHLHEVSLDVLEKLPLDVQLDVARRLKVPFGQWVVQMALRMGGTNGGCALLSEFKEEAVDGFVATYKWWRNLERKPDVSSLHLEIEQRLLAGLRATGWQVGLLKTRSYKGRKQFCVEINGRKYVMDGHQHDYGTFGGQRRQWPHDGDTVMFRPESGFQLVPGKVYAVYLTLVRPAPKK